MKEQIKIPNSLSDMDISHLPFFLELTKYTEVDLMELEPSEISDLNAIFFSKPARYFDKYDTPSNKKILNEIYESCKKRYPENIKQSYTIGGKEYNFVKDYSKQPVSFHRDIAQADFIKYPLDLLAFCYIENGMMYNELEDKTSNILNPRRERGELFRDEISLAEYLDLQGFFLESYAVFRPYFKVKKAREK